MEGRGGGRTKQVVLYFFNTPFSLVCLASIHVPLARTLNYKGGWEISRCVIKTGKDWDTEDYDLTSRP